MPAFTDSVTVAAPPEEVWKILYDPSQLTRWWADLADVDVAPAGAPDADVRVYYTDEPDVPRPQRRRADTPGLRLLISCLSTDISFTWVLEPVDDGAGTGITVLVDIPTDQGHLLETHRARTSTSLRQLAALAQAAAGIRS